MSPTIVEKCPPTVVEKCPPLLWAPVHLLLCRIPLCPSPSQSGHRCSHPCRVFDTQLHLCGTRKGFCSHTTHHHLCPWDLANFWFLPPFKVQRSPTLGKTGKRRSVLKPNLCEISSQAQKGKWQGMGGEETKKFNGTLFKRRPLRIL